MSTTVIVSAAAYLPALLAQDDLTDALAFSDADALKALEAIIRERPKTIALEKLFAATSRGAALIKRIKADPTLRGCNIRIVSHDGAEDPGGYDVQTDVTGGGGGRLDVSGTRRAPRAKMGEGIEALIDGSPATLVDVSVVGAQVISPTILRPNQRSRMVLPGDDRPIRVTAVVAWALFELPATGPQYRAGIEFYDAEVEEMVQFIDRYRALDSHAGED